MPGIKKGFPVVGRTCSWQKSCPAAGDPPWNPAQHRRSVSEGVCGREGALNDQVQGEWWSLQNWPATQGLALLFHNAGCYSNSTTVLFTHTSVLGKRHCCTIFWGSSEYGDQTTKANSGCIRTNTTCACPHIREFGSNLPAYFSPVLWGAGESFESGNYSILPEFQR